MPVNSLGTEQAMTSPTTLDNQLQQIRMNALAAKYLHQVRLNTLRRCITAVDVIAMIVPISFFPIRYLLKGSVIGAYAEIVWEVLASLLFALSLLRIILKWQESAEKHNELLARNISLANDAEQMLDGGQIASSEDVKYFSS